MSKREERSGLMDLTGIEPSTAVGWLEQMLLIREFEGRANELALAGHIPGGVHSSIGQEAVAIGVMSALSDGDHSAATHRSHHHALAMGIPARALMAELMGKAAGCNGGRGGSMHVADLTRGFIGGNGIVGAGIGLATGAAFSFKTRATSHVAVGFVGDGGVNTGRTWESLNLATVWSLPLIAVCENNLYAVETTTAALTASASIAARAAGFGIEALTVDGQDVASVHRAATAAVLRARAGAGPTFLEMTTYRYEGHNTGQAITYRTDDEVSQWRTRRDPIGRLGEALMAGSALTEAEFEGLAAGASAAVSDAVEFAHAAPWPESAAATTGVTELGVTVRRLS